MCPPGLGREAWAPATLHQWWPPSWCHLWTQQAPHPRARALCGWVARDQPLCPHRQYYWYDERGKKVKCTAPQYVDFVMSSVQKLVTDEDVFPTKYGRSQSAARGRVGVAAGEEQAAA